MQYNNFSINELERLLQTKLNIEEKILFLADEILNGNRLLVNIRQAIYSVKEVNIAITTKEHRLNSLINELLLDDGILNSKLIHVSINSIKESLCEKVEFYINHAKELKEHIVKRKKYLIDKCSKKEKREQISSNISSSKKIIWKGGKEKLIKLFEVLTKNEILPFYNKEKILAHFCDEKLAGFSTDISGAAKFIWQDSDSSFAVFINELAKHGVIDDYKKFSVFCEHFANSRGDEFKYLSQKRNYSDNLNKRESLIKELLGFLK